MKFSYFNDHNGRQLAKTLLHGITNILGKLTPRFSGYLGSKILMNPYGRRNYQFKQIKPTQELKLDSKIGKVHINRFGDGEQLILLNHGWGDNSFSFEPLIGSLVKAGYSVVAFDHLGHGKSEGKYAHLPAFIDTLQTVITHFEQQSNKITAIVGHSMGGMAALNLPEQQRNDKKLLLVAVPIDFFNIMFNKVENVGISRLFLTRVLERITSQFNTNWQQLSQHQLLRNDHQNVLFIHDKDDRYAPLDDIEHYVQQSKSKLVTSEGLGHRRILSDTSIITAITDAVTT